jgi:hypothetical protein
VDVARTVHLRVERSITKLPQEIFGSGKAHEVTSAEMPLLT